VTMRSRSTAPITRRTRYANTVLGVVGGGHRG
jgi:hypothetical protein